MTNETETKKSAGNVVFLLKGESGNEQVVSTFRAGDTVDGKVFKSPKRALTRFLQKVAEDEGHSLHKSLVNGELKQTSGHPKQVSLTTKSVVS